MIAKVHVTLKPGVLDPQGKAIASALNSLGFDEVQAARQGKIIELDLKETDRTTAMSRINAMCEKLIANTVIESYAVTLED